MTTHEYLQKLGIQPDSHISLAFMVGEVIGETVSSRRIVYHSTPIHDIRDWYHMNRIDPKERVRNKVLDYIILNTQVHDLNWLCGANWNVAIDNHRQMMILVISREELEKYYSPKQARETELYIEEKILVDIENGRNPWIGKK